MPNFDQDKVDKIRRLTIIVILQINPVKLFRLNQPKSAKITA